MPTLLRETLEETAQWGAVRVIPNTADFVDVIVTGKVIDSNGGFLAVDITRHRRRGPRVDQGQALLAASSISARTRPPRR